MKFSKNIPETDLVKSELLTKEGWKKLKEPSSPGRGLLFSLPFMFINAFIFLIFSYLLNPQLYKSILALSEFNLSISLNLKVLMYLIGVLVIFALHELLHAIIIPNFIRSDKTLWGINGVGLFIYSAERISKIRFVLISIMPFVVLSIIFPIILAILGLFNVYAIILGLLNAMGSSVDFLNLFLVLIQVPKDSLILANGGETYYQNNL